MTELQNLPLEQLQPNPWNRTVFDPQALEELAASIKAEGIREPLIVRPSDGGYQIASGHRRWLAAQKVGLIDVPCLIESMSDQDVAEDNITINLQREDLPALELARMLDIYRAQYGKSQVETAKTFGKTEAWVSQYKAYLGVHQDLKNLTTVKFSTNDLRTLLQLSPTLQQQIAKELEAGTLKAEYIQKRCHQLLFTVKKPYAPPPDPLAGAWVNLKQSTQMAPEKWDVHRSVGKYTLTVNTGDQDPVGTFVGVLQFILDNLSPLAKMGTSSKDQAPITWEEYEAQIRKNAPPEQVEQLLKMAKMNRQMHEPGADPDKVFQDYADDLEQTPAPATPKSKLAAILARRRGIKL